MPQVCTPANVFGPTEQTMFLGCSVTSFSANVGWNQEVSTLDVNLIRDDCASPPGHFKKYYEAASSPIERQWTAADPGFEIFGSNQNEPPPIGAPCYFRFGDFEFTGLIQSWTKHDSSQGRDLYTVRLIDPREILGGCEVIIGDYAGSVGNAYNLFNVYGFQERFRGSFCPSFSTVNDGVIFGSVAQAFGGADLTENGMSWNRIREGISILTSSIPSANTLGAAEFSPYGRIVYRGGLPNARFGLLPPDDFSVQFEGWFGEGFLGYLSYYFLDLADLPVMPTDYRVAGSSVNLLDLISQVCEDSNCDFYIELIPVQFGTSLQKFIKVRSVSRAVQPNMGAIEAFVENLDQPIDKSIGRELRNEVHTKLLIGGNKKTIWQAEQNTNPSFDPDSTCISNTLTGKSRQFVAANNQLFTRTHDATFHPGTDDFWTHSFFYIDSAGTRSLWTRYSGGGSAQISWATYMLTDNRFRLLIGDSSTFTVVTNTSVILETGKWYSGFAWKSGGTIYIRLDNGTIVSSATSVTPYDGSLNVQIGAINSTGGQLWDGRIARAGFGRVTTGTLGDGSEGTLAHAIASRLYNGGEGLIWDEITSQERTDWGLEANSGAYFDLNEDSGNAIDRVNNLNLNNVNAVSSQKERAALADDIIAPYWGLDANNNAIVTNLDANGWWEFEAPTIAINDTLTILSFGVTTVTINELELKAACAGFDEWTTHSETTNTDINKELNIKGLFRKLTQFFIDNADIDGRDGVKANNDQVFIKNEILFNDLQKVWNWVRQFATEYYGRRFMVRIPYNCVFQNSDGVITQITSPTDGGWTEEPTVIGLSHPSIFTDFFENEDGTLGAFVLFNNLDDLNISDLPQDSYAYSITTNQIWIKITLYPDFVYVNHSIRCSPRAVIELPTVINGQDRDGKALFFRYAAGFKNAHDRDGSGHGPKAEDAIKNKLEKELLSWSECPTPILPTAAAIPLINHVNTYGPWITNNIPGTGPPGQTIVEKDDGLVPWEHGNLAVLNTIGQALANAGVSNMQVGELGNITFAGMPDIPLGAEIGAVAGIAPGTSVSGSFFKNNENKLENRSFTSENVAITDSHTSNTIQVTNFNTTFGQWTGLFGPSITSINVNIGEDGIKTNYVMRTFTSKRGIFNKLFADRIKKNAILRRQQQKQLRLLGFINELRLQKKKLGEGKISSSALSTINQIQGNKGTPHSVLVAELKSWDKIAGSGDDEWRRTIIADKSIFDIINNLSDDNYEKYAMMSWDGLIRPVSMDGRGGLPQYFNKPTAPCAKSTSRGAIPPLTKPGGGEIYNLLIDIDYLNPLSNPTSLARSTINDRHAGDIGHDIDIIGRGVSISGDGSHISMHTHTDGYNSVNRADYKADYSFMALRGPLVIQGWGYDTDGKPIPNAADVESSAEQGIFTNVSLEDEFLSEFLRKPHTWPVAPVDLRFDRQRGVWVAPPQHLLVEATLQGSLPAGGTVTAFLNDGPALYDADGNSISYGGLDNAPTIIVHDKTDTALSSGDKILAYYNTDKCEYWLIEAPPSGSGDVSITNSGCINTLPDFTTINKMVFGTGLKVEYDNDNNAWISSAITFNNSTASLCNSSLTELLPADNDFTSEDFSSDFSTIGNEVTYLNFERIRFGKGISALVGEDPCEVHFCLAQDIDVSATCHNPTKAIPSDFRADTLQFGDGLSVHSGTNECEAIIAVTLSALNKSGSPKSNRISKFQEGSGIIFTELTVGDCKILEISTESGTLSIADSGCNYGVGTFTEVTRLVGGVGIKAELTHENWGLLNHDIRVQQVGTSFCDPGTTLIGATTAQYDQMMFGKGLKIYRKEGSGQDCTVNVSFGADIAQSDNCYYDIDDPGTMIADSFEFGDGLRITSLTGTQCGKCNVHLAFTAIDAQDQTIGDRFSKLQAGSGITFTQISSGNCRILEINASGSLGIADSGCNTSLGAFTELSQLVAGTGIAGRVDSDGVGIFNLDLKLNSNTVSLCTVGQTQITSPAVFENINFGNGLFLSKSASDNCTANVSAYTQYIGDRTICYDSTKDKVILNAPNLVYIGDGLELAAFDKTGVSACDTGVITLAMTALDIDGATPISHRISKLQKGVGVDFTELTNGNCKILEISATGSGILNIADSGCNYGLGAFTEITKLVGGVGIKAQLTQNNTIGLLNHDIKIADTSISYCNTDQTNSLIIATTTIYDQLLFGNGLKLFRRSGSGQDCTAYLAVGMDVSSVGDCYNPTNDPGGILVTDSFRFGDGLQITEANDASQGGINNCGQCTVHLAFTALNDDNTTLDSRFSRLKEGNNVTFDREISGNCHILKINAGSGTLNIADSGCDYGLGAFTNVSQLVGGRGIRGETTNIAGTVGGLLNHDLKLESGFSTIRFCPNAPRQISTDDISWDTLRFCRNIHAFREVSDPCRVNISSTMHMQSNGLCYDPIKDVLNIEAESINVGDGLRITSDGGQICGDATIHLAITALHDNGSAFTSTFSRLKEGSNVTFDDEFSGGCHILKINAQGSGIEIANSGCNAPLGGFFTTNKLVAGIGIQSSVENDTVILNHNIRVLNDTSSFCDSSTTPITSLDSHYNNLIFGKGLYAFKKSSDNCTAHVSFGVNVSSVGNCYNPTNDPGGILITDSFRFGDGLGITEASTVDNCGECTVHLAFTALHDTGSAVGNRFSKLKEGNNVSFEQEIAGDCRILKINAGALGIADSGCSYGLGTFTNITKLVGGRGIKGEITKIVGVNEGLLNHDIKLSSNNSLAFCDFQSFQVGSNDVNWDNLIFGRNIRAFRNTSQSCAVNISAGMDLASDTTCFSSSTSTNSIFAESMSFGQGLKLSSDTLNQDCGDASVHLAMNVGSLQNIASFSEGCGIDFTQDGTCNAKITSFVEVNNTKVNHLTFDETFQLTFSTLNGCPSVGISATGSCDGFTGTVSLLDGVTCVSGNIVGSFTDLTFDDGCLISVVT